MTSGIVRDNEVSWDNLAAYRKAAKDSLSRLSLIKPGPDGGLLTLLCASRNEADILPAFLDHYRAIGVKRFVIIDNDSSDNSVEILSAADDVELYWTDAKYADNNGSRFWIDGIAYEKYLNNWILVADADEQLVYSDCFERPLPELILFLTQRGLTKLFAPMVDVYPLEGDVLHFDKSPDLVSYWGIGPRVCGGPRYRMATRFNLNTRPCLTKYPLVFYDQDTAFVNSHFPWPHSTNGTECFARVLHTKLGARFSDKVTTAVEEGQHWQNSVEYRDYARWMTEDLRHETSSRYKNPGDLVSAELMKPVPWQELDEPRPNDNILASASVLAILYSELCQERLVHAETRRSLQEFRQKFEEAPRKIDELLSHVDILSKKIDQLADRQLSVGDVAREVWFERQRWGLPLNLFRVGSMSSSISRT